MEYPMDFAQRGQESRWLADIRDGLHNRKMGPIATALLAVGLVFAIATDGSLPVIWSRVLFGLLFVLNIVMIDWLTGQRD